MTPPGQPPHLFCAPVAGPGQAPHCHLLQKSHFSCPHKASPSRTEPGNPSWRGHAPQVGTARGGEKGELCSPRIERGQASGSESRRHRPSQRPLASLIHSTVWAESTQPAREHAGSEKQPRTELTMPTCLSSGRSGGRVGAESMIRQQIKTKCILDGGESQEANSTCRAGRWHHLHHAILSLL